MKPTIEVIIMRNIYRLKVILATVVFLITSDTLAAQVNDHIAISKTGDTVWVAMVGVGFTVTNPTDQDLTLTTISFHIPTNIQLDISNVLSLENISADIPSYDQNNQEYTYVMSNSGQTLQSGESIQSMFYVQTNDNSSSVSSSSMDIYANEGQLNLALSSSEDEVPELNATITSVQGDIEISQPMTDIISLPGAQPDGAAYQIALDPIATENDDGSITEIIADPVEQNITVVTGEVTKATFQYNETNYTQEEMYPVNVSVTSLSSSNVSGSVTATSSNNLTFIHNSDLSSEYTTVMYLPKDDQTYTVTPKISGYNLTGSCTTTSSEMDCSYDAEVKHLMIGYWADWGPWSIAETADQDFNMLIIAFGTLDSDAPSLEAFGPDVTKEVLIEDIQTAKEAHPDLSVLISFGGANNTYFVDDDLTDDQIDTLASKLNDFLDEYDLDGVDFDVEEKYSYYVLHTLIQDLQTYRSDAGKSPYIITAAPQLNTDSNGDPLMVSSGYEPQPYYESLDDTSGLADFNYIMVQEYNTPLSPAFSYNDQSLYENDFDMISGSFNMLKLQLPSDSNTKLVLGEPASYHSASAASIFYDFTDAQYTQRDLATVVSGVISQVYQIKDDPQFGGIMEWDTYDDQIYNDTEYGFSQGIIPCVVNGECEE